MSDKLIISYSVIESSARLLNVTKLRLNSVSRLPPDTFKDSNLHAEQKGAATEH